MLRYPVLNHFELERRCEDIYMQVERVGYVLNDLFFFLRNLTFQKIFTKYRYKADLSNRGSILMQRPRVLLVDWNQSRILLSIPKLVMI